MARKSKDEKTLSYRVRDDIRQMIVRGVYRPGDPLREAELTDQLGVSRSPVREGLRLLIPTGLVEYQLWRGFHVKEYTPEHVVSLYRLRAIMEGMLVSDLKGKDVSPVIAKLELLLVRMQASFEKGDIDTYFQDNLDFHQSIIEFTGNSPMLNILNNINEICMPARYALISWVFPNMQAINTHREIINALNANDLLEVKRLVEEHILEDLEPVKAAYTLMKKKMKSTGRMTKLADYATKAQPANKDAAGP